MRGKRLTGAVFAALVCVALFGPAPAAAGVVTIMPGDLIPVRADLQYQQDQFRLSVPQGQAPRSFNAPVKLPVGAVVTKVEILYYGTDSLASMYVTLKRTKFGAGPLADFYDDMVQFHPMGDTLLSIESESSTAIQSAKIPRGYSCFLNVHIVDDGSQFFGAKVYYR